MYLCCIGYLFSDSLVVAFVEVIFFINNGFPTAQLEK